MNNPLTNVHPIPRPKFRPNQAIILIGPDRCATCGAELISEARLINPISLEAVIPITPKDGRKPTIYHCPLCKGAPR